MGEMLKFKGNTYQVQEVGEHSEKYTLAKITSTDKSGRTITDVAVLNSQDKIVSIVDVRQFVFNILYRRMSHDADGEFAAVLAKLEEVMQTAKLGKFQHGLATIESSFKTIRNRGENVDERNYDCCYYVTRDGFVLGSTKNVDGAKKTDKKDLKALKLAKSIWENPNKLRKIRRPHHFDNDLLYSIWDKPCLDEYQVKGLYDVANHSLLEKQAKDRTNKRLLAKLLNTKLKNNMWYNNQIEVNSGNSARNPIGWDANDDLLV